MSQVSQNAGSAGNLGYRQLLVRFANDWWVFLLRGIVAVVFGIVAWAWPGLTLLALIIVFGAYAVVDGVFAIVAAFMDDRADRQARLLAGAGGALTLLVGLIALFSPGITATTLMYFIAFWAIFAGVSLLAHAIRYRKEISNEVVLGLTGLASIVFGVIVAIFPGSGALALTWLIGLYAILFGVLLIAFAFRLRGIRSDLRAGRPVA